MIEVRLKEAYACEMPRQSKGFLYNSTSLWSFLETSSRLVFTFCHAALYSTYAPERMAALLRETNSLKKERKKKITTVLWMDTRQYLPQNGCLHKLPVGEALTRMQQQYSYGLLCRFGSGMQAL